MADMNNTLTKVAVKAGPIIAAKAAPVVGPVLIETAIAVAPVVLPAVAVYGAYRLLKDIF